MDTKAPVESDVRNAAPELHKKDEQPQPQASAKPLEGWVVCMAGWFTGHGYTHGELGAEIQRRGGRVTQQCTSKTTHFLYGTRAMGSKKWNMAQEKGLAFIAAEDFFPKFLEPAPAQSEAEAKAAAPVPDPAEAEASLQRALSEFVAAQEKAKAAEHAMADANSALHGVNNRLAAAKEAMHNAGFSVAEQKVVEDKIAAKESLAHDMAHQKSLLVEAEKIEAKAKVVVTSTAAAAAVVEKVYATAADDAVQSQAAKTSADVKLATAMERASKAQAAAAQSAKRAADAEAKADTGLQAIAHAVAEAKKAADDVVQAQEATVIAAARLSR